MLVEFRKIIFEKRAYFKCEASNKTAFLWSQTYSLRITFEKTFSLKLVQETLEVITLCMNYTSDGEIKRIGVGIVPFTPWNLRYFE